MNFAIPNFEDLSRGLTYRDFLYHYWRFSINICYKTEKIARKTTFKDFITERNSKCFDDRALTEFLGLFERFEESSFDILMFTNDGGKGTVVLDFFYKLILVWNEIEISQLTNRYLYVPEYIKKTKRILDSDDLFKNKSLIQINDFIKFWEPNGRILYQNNRKNEFFPKVLASNHSTKNLQQQTNNSATNDQTISVYTMPITNPNPKYVESLFFKNLIELRKSVGSFKIRKIDYKYIGQLKVSKILREGNREESKTKEQFKDLVKQIARSNGSESPLVEFKNTIEEIDDNTFLTAIIDFENSNHALKMIGKLDQRLFNEVRLIYRPNGFRNNEIEKTNQKDYSKQECYINGFIESVENARTERKNETFPTKRPASPIKDKSSKRKRNEIENQIFRCEHCRERLSPSECSSHKKTCRKK